MRKSLIIDANNLLYRTFFAQIDEAEDIVIAMCHHSALWSMQKYYNEYPADDVVVAFDSYSWRKLYTKNLDECVTYKKYKGHRRQNLTPSQQKKLDKFDQHVNEFGEMLKSQTSLLVLQEKYLEADDLIAGYIQRNPDMKHVLITSDKDYIQLLGKNNLTIIDPDSGKPRSLKDWNDDPEFFMFEKCLRGDTSDNVMSAYPRLRSKKILEAYSDEYAKTNIMNHKFKVLVNKDDGSIEEQNFSTQEVFEENNMLMNLEARPENIRALIEKSIQKSLENRSSFNYFKFVKFCGKHQLQNILDKVDRFVPMLSNKSN